jgi:hypothetical protein
MFSSINAKQKSLKIFGAMTFGKMALAIITILNDIFKFQIAHQNKNVFENDFNLFRFNTSLLHLSRA